MRVYLKYTALLGAITFCLLGITQLSFAKVDEFPGRKLYPAVEYIELDDLYKSKGQSIIIDVRSSYEYETLRIKHAINIPINSKNYINDIRELIKNNPGKKVIVYCNGKTCMKSYKAVMKCRRNNVKGVISYDAGIMDWARKYPEESVLLGASPIDPAKLISKSKFKTHLIGPEEFEKRVNDKDVIVLDLRGQFQRDATGLFSGIEERVYIDDKESLANYVRKANNEKKTLLIYDAAGKQVRWLMYYLEANNANSYKFMTGGARGYYKVLRALYTK